MSRARDKTKLREYSKRHYEKNKPAMIARAKAHNAVVRDRLRVLIDGYLAEHPCIDCGEADPVVLEFDHRKPAEKLFNIGDARRRRRTVNQVTAEIAKCDVRCANCHRRKTFRDRDWERAGIDGETGDIGLLPLFEGR